jgi:hypothetical protein
MAKQAGEESRVKQTRLSFFERNQNPQNGAGSPFQSGVNMIHVLPCQRPSYTDPKFLRSLIVPFSVQDYDTFQR